MTRFCFAAFFVLVASESSFAHKPTVTTFTYYKDIYSIFESKCGSCHQTGGVAPMSLLTYEEAFPWAVSIKNEVLHLSMPPWSADDRYGVFQHNGGLSAEQMNTIVDWCLGGSPEGVVAERIEAAPPPPPELGEPGLMLEMPEPVILDADTSEASRDVVLRTGLRSDTYVRAVDFLPGAANIVRGVIVSLEGTSQPLTTWVPGQRLSAFESGHGQLVPAGAALHVRIHYKKTWLDDGSRIEDKSTLALYFEPSARAVDTVPVVLGEALTLDSDRELVALLPQLEAPADSVMAELVRADGSREPLLRLHRPSPSWPRKYWLEEPLRLPAGSRVEVTATTSGEESPAAIWLDLVSNER